MSDLRERVAKELAKADDCDSEWEDWSEDWAEDSREMYRQIADRILAIFDEERRELEKERDGIRNEYFKQEKKMIREMDRADVLEARVKVLEEAANRSDLVRMMADTHEAMLKEIARVAELREALSEGIGLLEWTEDDDWWTEEDFNKQRDVWLKKVAALGKDEKPKRYQCKRCGLLYQWITIPEQPHMHMTSDGWCGPVEEE